MEQCQRKGFHTLSLIIYTIILPGCNVHMFLHVISWCQCLVIISYQESIFKKKTKNIFVRENILIRIQQCLDVINKCYCYTSYICILFGVSVFLFFGTSKLKTNHMKV